MSGEAFATYVETQLALELEPGTVVILGNPGTYWNARAGPALSDQGRRLLLLPPYSPDLNPIKTAFSKPRALLCVVGARDFDQLLKALGKICGVFSPDECRNYFQNARYVSTQARGASKRFLRQAP